MFKINLTSKKSQQAPPPSQGRAPCICVALTHSATPLLHGPSLAHLKNPCPSFVGRVCYLISVIPMRSMPSPYYVADLYLLKIQIRSWNSSCAQGVEDMRTSGMQRPRSWLTSPILFLMPIVKKAYTIMQTRPPSPAVSMKQKTQVFREAQAANPA